jgi:hypothetical protein
MNDVRGYLSSGQYDKVIFAGHSLGGAMVQEAMDDLYGEFSGVDLTGITFGSPGSGSVQNQNFLNSNILNFGFDGDLVYTTLGSVRAEVMAVLNSNLTFRMISEALTNQNITQADYSRYGKDITIYYTTDDAPNGNELGHHNFGTEYNDGVYSYSDLITTASNRGLLSLIDNASYVRWGDFFNSDISTDSGSLALVGALQDHSDSDFLA